jgi:hypothetical protein
MHGDWITATATVLAAVIGIVGGYILAKYQREKRILRFVVMKPQDLAASLRAHGDFVIKFAEFSTRQLVLATVSVRNTGNCSIKDLVFNLKIPGDVPFSHITCSSDNMTIAEQVTVGSEGRTGNNPAFAVSLPFFNANESFLLNVLYSGKSSECEIACRLPDTTVEVLTVHELYRANDRHNFWMTVFTVALAAIVGTIFALAAGLIGKVLKGGL